MTEQDQTAPLPPEDAPPPPGASANPASGAVSQAADAPIAAPAAQEPKSTVSASDLKKARELVETITKEYSAKVVGQERLRTSLLIALIANGHILLESVPGLAKTTAAMTLADTIHADFKRIQCTPDIMPSDITGNQIYDASSGTFRTVLGPVHANIVLLDEINRSSAKTQSAMLEAMQERQTTIGGEVYPLPKPFLVIATQNPIEQEGTYELPEAQMDRFLLKEIVEYPSPLEEIEILRRIDSGVLDVGSHQKARVDLDDIATLQRLAREVYVSDAVRTYIVQLIYVTRNPAPYIGPDKARLIKYGASPRASIAFMAAARALALMDGRGYVTPDDIRALRYEVLRHRVLLTFEADAEGIRSEQIIDDIFASVPTP